ncbi:MAG: hypothetical protein IK077_06245 [Thermoguttaceae bacterium]|nr:hypothetical protein [Thermoguttaceae bacterium]
MNHTLKRSKYAAFAIAVLGIACFLFVESARAQNLAVWKGALGFDDAARTVTRESSRYGRYAVTTFVARLSGSDGYYPHKISTLGALMTPVVETLDKSDLAPDEKERLRASVLKQAREMKEAIRETILFESPDRDEDADRGAEILRSVLTRVGAQDELDAFERELRQWRDDAKNDALQNVLNGLPVDSETGETPTEPTALIEIFRKLIDEERAKSEPDQDLLDLMEFRLFVVVKRLTWDRPEEAEQILRDAIERENDADPPNEKFLNSYRRELEEQEYRRLIHNKDADGAFALWRQTLERRFEDYRDDKSRIRMREIIRVLQQIDQEKANDAVYETLERCLASGNGVLIAECEYLLGYRKYEETNVKLEGICLDGTPLNWNDYVGKPGVIVFFRFNSYNGIWNCDPAHYYYLRRYAHCEGANIIAYATDDVPENLESYHENTKWKTVSRKLTLEANDRKYLDVGLYYDFGVDLPKVLPKSISSKPAFILYDERGKVVQFLREDSKTNQYYKNNLWIVEDFLYQNSPEIVQREDEEIFKSIEVPEGKDFAFYYQKRKKLDEIRNSMSSFNSGNPTFAERFNNIYQKIEEAIRKNEKLLVQTSEADDSLDLSAKAQVFVPYVERIKREKDRAAMKELLEFERSQGEFGRQRADLVELELRKIDFELAKEAEDQNSLESLQKLIDEECGSDNPNVNSIRYFTRRILEIKIKNAIRENNEDALKEALDECAEAEVVEDEDLQKRPEFLYVTSVIRDLKVEYNRPDDAEYLRKSALNKFKLSETPRSKQLASELAAVDRRNDLRGNKLTFRGSFYNPDDSFASQKFDWESYQRRGNPVLIFCYAPKNIAFGLEDVLRIYRKYHDAGMEVVGYYDSSLIVDAPAERANSIRQAFAEEYKKRNLPWQTVWNKRGEQKAIHYESLVKYYDLPTPSAILVDADGKVIDVYGVFDFTRRLQDDLKKLFPNVQ